MKKKVIIIILLIGIGLPLFLPWIYVVCFKVNEISFETLSKGRDCSHSARGGYIINSQDNWEELWDITFSNSDPYPNVPPINFTRNTIIAVYSGAYNSCGYSVEIIKIEERNFGIIVYIREIPLCVCCYVMVQTYHIVETRKLAPSNIIFRASTSDMEL